MENASPVITVPRQQRANVLPLQGEIDLHVLPVVRESLNVMIQEKPERIVVDLSRATYIDSAGLGALILAMQEVEAYGGRFFLTVCMKASARFSKLRGLIKYFGFCRV